MRAIPEGWQVERLGGEDFWVREHSEVAFLIGLGPAAGAVDPGERLAELARQPPIHFRALRYADQVHGTLIASLGEETPRSLTGVASVGRCDGLMTDVRGLGLAVWTADCVPLLLAGGGVVAAVHAGWRGAAAGIVRRVVRRFAVEYGVTAGVLEAVLGPAVASCHYEVGDEALAALVSHGPAQSSWRRGHRVDLRDFVAAQLIGLGVEADAVERVGPCTACDSELASYRRDGERAGRQVAIVALSGRRPVS